MFSGIGIGGMLSSDFARGRWSSHVHPQYYGLMLFAQAAPPGSRLLRVAGAHGDLRAFHPNGLRYGGAGGLTSEYRGEALVSAGSGG